MELQNEFPKISNDYKMTKENNDKVQNTITNNIYGDNNPLNIAAGQNVVQKDVQNIFKVDEVAKLEKLGVEIDDIEKLKQIVSSSGNDKATLKEKSTKWLGGVLASVGDVDFMIISLQLQSLFKN